MRGFFTLRPCEQPATQTCARCQRMICQAHLSAAAAPPLCLECAARDDEARAFDGDYDDAWVHRYRHHYYIDHSYRPYYRGSRFSDPYYNAYDARVFDQNAAGVDPDDHDDGAGGGLGDS